MGFRTVEMMKTKDGFVDRVNRFEQMNGPDGAKARMYFLLWNCTADPNLEYAVCTIENDMGAVLKNERYDNDVATPMPEPVEPEEEPEEEGE